MVVCSWCRFIFVRVPEWMKPCLSSWRGTQPNFIGDRRSQQHDVMNWLPQEFHRFHIYSGLIRGASALICSTLKNALLTSGFSPKCVTVWCSVRSHRYACKHPMSTTFLLIYQKGFLNRKSYSSFLCSINL